MSARWRLKLSVSKFTLQCLLAEPLTSFRPTNGSITHSSFVLKHCFIRFSYLLRPSHSSALLASCKSHIVRRGSAESCLPWTLLRCQHVLKITAPLIPQKAISPPVSRSNSAETQMAKINDWTGYRRFRKHDDGDQASLLWTRRLQREAHPSSQSHRFTAHDKVPWVSYTLIHKRKTH